MAIFLNIQFKIINSKKKNKLQWMIPMSSKCKSCDVPVIYKRFCNACNEVLCSNCKKPLSLCPEHYDKLSSSDKTKIKLHKIIEYGWKIVPYTFFIFMFVIPALLTPDWPRTNLKLFITLAVISIVIGIASLIFLLIYEKKLKQDMNDMVVRLKVNQDK